MSEAVVDRILIAIGLDTKQVDKGMATVQNKLVTGLSGIASKLFAPLLAGVTISFGALFDSIYSEMKQMNALSKATHTNIEDMTAWARAVNMSGGDIEAFQGTLMGLNQNLTRIAVTGHSRIKPFFEALGLDAVELAKKPVLESLSAIGKAIDGMDKRQSANMLRSMGFDKGTIKLLQSGEKGMKQLIARQKELGVYTAKDAKALAAMNKGFKEITSAIKTMFIPAFSLIISVAARVTKYLTSVILFLRKNLNAIRPILIGIAIAMSGKLIPAFMDFLTMLMANPLGAFMAALGSLFLLFDDLYTYAEGGESAFEDFWASFGTPQQVMDGINSVIDKVREFFKVLAGIDVDNSALTGWAVLGGLIGIAAAGIVAFLASLGAIPIAIGVAVGLLVAYWNEISAFFKQLIENVKALPDAIVEGLKIIVNLAKGLVGAVLDGIVMILSAIFTGIAETAKTVFTGIAETARDIITGIIAFFQNIGATINAVFVEAAEVFSDMFSSAGNTIESIFNSVSNAISTALTNAANSAKSAWNGFITWLEEKWNWIKSLLPSLEGIASKLPGFSNAGKLTTKGGTTNNTTNSTDNSQKTYNVTLSGAAATRTFMQNSGYVPQADGGINK